MIFVIKYSLKRFWRKRSQVLLTSIFLCLGFWGWLLSEGTQSSIRQRLEQNAQKILSADLTIDVRREFSDEESFIIEKAIGNYGTISKSYEFFAMMTTSDESRLVQVRAIDDFYPFYGKVVLQGQSQTSDLHKNVIWAYKEFQDLLNLRRNDEVQLGKAKFKVADFINQDETQTFRLAALAPRVFLHVDNLKETELIQFGSTFSSIRLVKMRPNAPLDLITENLQKSLKDPGIDITNYKTLPDELSGPTQRLSDFLGLTSLVSLLFCSLSLFYLLQIWSSEQQKEKAALAVFGMPNGKIQQIEFIQSVLIASLSTGLSTLLVIVSTPLIESSIRSWFAEDFVFQVSIREVTIILICQLILLAVLTFPFQSQGSALTRLLKDELLADQKGVKYFVPLIVLIWPFAIFASRSWKNGTYFFAAIVAVCAALIFLGWASLLSLQKAPWKSWKISYSTRALARQSTASWAFIVTVGICSALLNLMPQIQRSLEVMMKVDSKSSFPSIFMFDIQQEQYPQVLKFLEDRKVTPQANSPLVRARITKVNGAPFEREQVSGQFSSREEQTDARMRNRSVNLTYRSRLQGEEKIVAGDEFPLVFDPKQKHAYVSVEKSYAKRLRFEIGDILTFDVQGIEIEAEIKNFREVKWSRFEPNFFILFQDGVLNDAPQTYLSALPQMDSKQKSSLMKDVSSEFGNISMIDIERLIVDLFKNLERVSGALKLMTGLSFLTGLLALVFLLTSESLRRASEIHLLKILGADSKSVLKTRLFEVSTLSLIALTIGLGSSYIIAAVIMTQVFQVSYTPDFSIASGIGFIILLIALSIVRFTTFVLYKQNSFLFLKKEE